MRSNKASEAHTSYSNDATARIDKTRFVPPRKKQPSTNLASLTHLNFNRLSQSKTPNLSKHYDPYFFAPMALCHQVYMTYSLYAQTELVKIHDVAISKFFHDLINP